MRDKFTIIGSGAWGTAMAMHLAPTVGDVMLWCYEPSICEAINILHENHFLSGQNLPANITATNDIDEALEFSDFVFWVVPVQHIRDVVARVKTDGFSQEKTFINMSKGLEITTHKLPLEILKEKFGDSVKYATLAGPSFAEEFAKNSPTILVAASNDENTKTKIQEIVQQGSVRVYTSNDVDGIQLAGAFKNIYAIAAGIADGMNLGDNARAALITRALVELTRLATKLKASSETIAGAAGIGDLILTCTSRKSRNYSMGLEIGQGVMPHEIIEASEKAVEGYYSAKAAFEMAKKIDVELPIANAIYEVLYENLSPLKAVKTLLERSPKPEWY